MEPSFSPSPLESEAKSGCVMGRPFFLFLHAVVLQLTERISWLKNVEELFPVPRWPGRGQRWHLNEKGALQGGTISVQGHLVQEDKTGEIG